MIGIYKITNLINGKKYVGQSIHIERRWKEHIYQNRNSAIHQAIEKYGVENFNFEIIEECPQSQLDEREIFWIKHFNSYENGYNLTPGGRTPFYYDLNAVKEIYNDCKSMSKTAKQLGCSENAVRNMLHSLDIYNIECQQEKKVDKIDPNTLAIITTYDSLTQAAQTEHVSLSAISMAVNGKSKSCNGFIWKNHDDPMPLMPISVKKAKRPVSQYDEYHNLIKTYESLASAARALGKSKSATNYIRKSCMNENITAYGYYWKYE